MENRPSYSIRERKLREKREEMYGSVDLSSYERLQMCKLRIYDLRQTLDRLPKKETEQPGIVKKVIDLIYELFAA